MDIVDKIEEISSISSIVEHNIQVFNKNIRTRNPDKILILKLEGMKDIDKLIDIIEGLGKYYILDKYKIRLNTRLNIRTYNKCYLRIDTSMTFPSELSLLYVDVDIVEDNSDNYIKVMYSYEDFISKYIEI